MKNLVKLGKSAPVRGRRGARRDVWKFAVDVTSRAAKGKTAAAAVNLRKRCREYSRAISFCYQLLTPMAP